MSKMNRLECMLSTIYHEDPHVIPQSISFMNSDASSKLSPDLSAIKDEAKLALRLAEFMDAFTIGCGGGGFRSKTLECGEHHRIVEWETGARWMFMQRPLSSFERRYIRHPVMCEDDLDALVLPDPDDPNRYVGIKEKVKRFSDKGFFTSCSINGFFSGAWYFIRPFNLWMRDLVINGPFAKRLIAKLGEFNLKAAKNCLETGVHSIGWVDDLGYNKGMFISPKTYEEVIYPWHKRAIDLAHKHGAFVNMHSHGNINAIFDLLADARLDVINPVGPSDNMDLRFLKEKYGDRITLQGGLSKFIGGMSKKELEDHIKERISLGAPGGGYIVDSEGGIPVNMKKENFEFFMKCTAKFRTNVPR